MKSIQVALQILVTASLIFQLFGLIVTWKIQQGRLQNSVVTECLRKRSYFAQKLKRRKERFLRRSKRSCWYKSGRTDLWWKNIFTGLTPEEFWKKNFRMPRDSFMKLVNELRPYISPDPTSPNKRYLSSEKKVAITLYFLKDTGSLGMTANSFGIAISTASAVITDVCNAISRYLGPKYIFLPKDVDSMRKKVSEFETKFGMTQAFGCIDGTHIPIKCPSENSQDYFCYKQFFSINVQAVCDFKGYFLDVECMWPGSVHDAKVFANSSINKKLRQNKLPVTYQTPVPGCYKVPNYLIADPAYPLLPHCIKEYNSCSTNAQVIFNSMLRSARNPVERAFGRLKARWVILTKPMNIKLSEVPTIMYACFVLHNYCEKHMVNIDQDLVNKQIEVIENNEKMYKHKADPIYTYNEGEGEVVRRVLTQIVLNNI